MSKKVRNASQVKRWQPFAPSRPRRTVVRYLTAGITYDPKEGSRHDLDWVVKEPEFPWLLERK